MLIVNKEDWLYKEFMQKPSLSLHLNDRCGNDCGICIYDCQPGNTGVLDKAVAYKAIDSMPKGTTIVFHGGEPLLNWDYFVEIAEYCLKNGYKINPVTNGYWCDDEEKTDYLIKNLSPIVCTISSDYWHQQKIPPKVIKKFINKTKNNPDVLIMFATVYSKKHPVEESIAPYGKNAIESAYAIKVQKLGRAESLPDSEFEDEDMIKTKIECTGLGVSIDCDGSIRAVCANENFSCVWGNIKNDDPWELYQKCHRPRYIVTGKFSWGIECCRFAKGNMMDQKWADPNYYEEIIGRESVTPIYV